MKMDNSNANTDNNLHEKTDKGPYDSKEVETKWQDYWASESIFKFIPDSPLPVFSIDNPPRYTSGPLHMGHAIGYSLIDFVARFKKMIGFNVFFPLCFDANGMPIEIKVEKKYGVNKKNTDRAKLIELCTEYSNSNIAEMVRQFRSLGITMDNSIYYQTDSPEYRKLTQITFLKLYENNMVYRKEHPVIWCPHCETSLAAADVEYDEESKNLIFINFKNEKNSIPIATTRPELLPTCQMVLINPEDNRYNNFVGQKVNVPIFNQSVPVMTDSKVDPSFGTGAVMVCTIGDKDDLFWTYKYNLTLLKGIDESGRLTDLAGVFSGLTIIDGRKAITNELQKTGSVIKIESIKQNVGKCWRCHTPVEFVNKLNWFLKTLDYKEEIKKISDSIIWHPEYMKKRLDSWIDSLLWDWCISRQRYFATAIPVWICEKCGYILPAKVEDCYIDTLIKEPYIEKCPECNGKLKGSDEVFDTWMDSSITPLYNSSWNRDGQLFKKLYPMSLRPQAHEIIRTWIFYTILRCKQMTDIKPWNEVMIHGFIMAPDGRPMHASAGNAIDPLPIIEKYGADAWRYYTAKCKLGEDTAFQIKEVIHGRKFMIKMYNVSKYIKMNVQGIEDIGRIDRTKELADIDKWILTKFKIVFDTVVSYYNNYEFDKAISVIEEFAWHDFADFYIEMSKERAKAHDASVAYTLYTVGIGIITLLTPITPHLAEEIYQDIYRKEYLVKSVNMLPMSFEYLYDEQSYKIGELLKNIISKIWTYSATAHVNSFRVIFIAGVLNDSLIEALKHMKKLLKTDDIRFLNNTDITTKPVDVRLLKEKVGSIFRNEMAKVIEIVNKQGISVLYRELMNNGYIDIELNGRVERLSKDYFKIETTEIVEEMNVKQIETSGMDIHMYVS